MLKHLIKVQGVRMSILALLLVVSFSAIGLAKQVVLQVAYPGWDNAEQETAVTSLVEEFHAENPDIRIELENYPWAMYRNRLVVQLQSGMGPDLGYNPNYWGPPWYRMGFLVDLTPYMDQLDVDDWFDGAWFPVEEGKIHSVPGRREPSVIFYNIDLFKAAGIEEFPETMEEFLEVAELLSEGDVRGFGSVMANHATFPGYILPFLYAFQENVMTLDGQDTLMTSPGFVEAVQFWMDMYSKYNVTQSSAPADSRDEVRRLFISGKVAMMVDGLWAVNTFQELAPDLNFGIAKVPRVEDQTHRTLTQGWDWFIYSHTEHPDEAFRVIEFFTRPENMARAEVTLPARKSAAEQERYQDPFYDIWFDALQYGRQQPNTEYYTEIFQHTLSEAVQKIAIRGVSVTEALQQASVEARAIIEQ